MSRTPGRSSRNTRREPTGSARVGCSMLAIILQVPIPFFFEGAPAGDALPGRLSSPDSLTDLMATRDGLALAKAFMRISNVELRRRIVSLVEEIEEHQD
jgi:hypothetical protein